MPLAPTERPDHAEFRRLLADIERVAQERDWLEVELGAARQDLAHLEAELRLARRDQAALEGTAAGYRRALAEAFNSGDGTYRP